MASTGFPVRSTDPGVIRSASSPLFASARFSGSYTSRPVSGTTPINTSVTIEPGKKFALQGIQIFCDRPYYIGITVRKVGNLNFNNISESIFLTLGDKEQQTILPYNEMLFEGAQVILSATSLVPTGETAAVTLRLIGKAQSLFETDNPDATIALIGDSKMMSTLDTGAAGERFYINQFVKSLQAEGKKISVVDKSMPGSSSSDGVKLVRAGAMDGFSYDLLVIGFGTNNAATTPTAGVLAQFKADLTEIMQHRNRVNPGASIILMTPGVTDKTSLVANIGAYRTAVAELASDTTLGSKIYLCQEHLAFTPSTTVKSDRFISTEALNAQVHYSVLGHDDVFTTQFLPVARSTTFYQTLKS